MALLTPDNWDLIRPVGAAFLLVLGLWGISTYAYRLLDRPYKHLVFWAAGVAFIVVTSALIIREKLNLPVWKGEINSIVYGAKINKRSDDVVVLAAVTIWNAGRLPSRVTNWQLLAKFDQATDAMRAELLSSVTVLLMDFDGSSKAYTAEDNILIKSLASIPAESKLSGILVGAFDGKNKELFTQPNVEYIVTFEDMLTQKHELVTRQAK